MEGDADSALETRRQRYIRLVKEDLKEELESMHSTKGRAKSLATEIRRVMMQEEKNPGGPEEGPMGSILSREREARLQEAEINALIEAARPKQALSFPPPGKPSWQGFEAFVARHVDAAAEPVEPDDGKVQRSRSSVKIIEEELSWEEEPACNILPNAREPFPEVGQFSDIEEPSEDGEEKGASATPAPKLTGNVAWDNWSDTEVEDPEPARILPRGGPETIRFPNKQKSTEQRSTSVAPQESIIIDDMFGNHVQDQVPEPLIIQREGLTPAITFQRESTQVDLEEEVLVPVGMFVRVQKLRLPGYEPTSEETEVVAPGERTEVIFRGRHVLRDLPGLARDLNILGHPDHGLRMAVGQGTFDFPLRSKHPLLQALKKPRVECTLTGVTLATGCRVKAMADFGALFRLQPWYVSGGVEVRHFPKDQGSGQGAATGMLHVSASIPIDFGPMLLNVMYKELTSFEQWFEFVNLYMVDFVTKVQEEKLSYLYDRERGRTIPCQRIGHKTPGRIPVHPYLPLAPGVKNKMYFPYNEVTNSIVFNPRIDKSKAKW